MLRAVSGSGSSGSSGAGVGSAAGAAYLSEPSIFLFGDSTDSQVDSMNYQVSGSTTTALTRSYRAFGWLLALSGRALNYYTCYDPSDNRRKGSNSGVGGASIPELRTRFNIGDFFSGFVPVKNRPEKYMWIQVGTNDINSGGTALGSAGFLPQFIINYTGLIQDILAAGKIPIVTTILPRNAVDGAFDWGTLGGTTAAQKRQVFNSANAWLMQYCSENNIACIPWHGAFSNNTGDAVTGFTAEGLHPNNRGSYYLAQEAYKDVAFLFGKSLKGSLNAYDVFDATYNPYGNILNGAMSGTGGAISVGAGTGTVTGTIANNFQLAKATSTSTSCVASIVTGPDGKLRQKFVFTSDGTGAAIEEWRYNYWTGASTTYAGFATYDDNLIMEGEWEFEGGHGGMLRGTQLRIGMNSGVTLAARTTISFDAATNRILDSANGFTAFAGLVNRVINIQGSTSNNRPYRIIAIAADGSSMTVDPAYYDNAALPSGNVTTEAAGASITTRLPAGAVVTNASSDFFPDEDSGVYWDETPVLIVPNTANMSPRAAIFINGTIAGTATVYLGKPLLRRMPSKPAVLNIVATER